MIFAKQVKATFTGISIKDFGNKHRENKILTYIRKKKDGKIEVVKTTDSRINSNRFWERFIGKDKLELYYLSHKEFKQGKLFIS